ncbi:MAG TPA: hypothetical protein VEP90_07605 [Methylomirabilota bacterium]|nr:hypothetical protein [Methylomirabilota bacterium]
MSRQQLDERQRQSAARHQQQINLNTGQREDRKKELKRSTALILAGFLCLIAAVATANGGLFSSFTKTMNADDATAFFLNMVLVLVFFLIAVVVIILLSYFGNGNKKVSPSIAYSSHEATPAENKPPNHHPFFIDPMDSTSTIRIRIVQEPLTAHNLTLILSSLTNLHTKCWLIAKRRFADLIEYTQTHDSRYTEEANLVIGRITHNSPADIKLNVNADASLQGLAEAIKIGIDAITHAPLRHEEAKLGNQALALEMKLREQEVQTTLADKEQARQIEAQMAELEKREKQLEIEMKQLDVEAKRLEIQEKRLDIEKKGIVYALETAREMINVLSPDADQETKELLLRTYLPDLLQLNNGKGLELALPAPQSKKDESAGD